VIQSTAQEAYFQWLFWHFDSRASDPQKPNIPTSLYWRLPSQKRILLDMPVKHCACCSSTVMEFSFWMAPLNIIQQL